MKMSSIKPVNKGGVKSKIICKYFMLGKCNKGENCPYLHSQIEKPKEMTQVECPMYSIGFCKNGPCCHFLHIKKDKFMDEEFEEKNTTSTTPNAEEHNNNYINNNINNKENSNENNIINNINKEKNGDIKDNNEENENYPELPIWYLEHYYDKPISMIFSDLEQKNLPEVAELKKKYGFTNIEPNLPMIQPINKKNLNMNGLNLNFNNFNMNLAFNNNHNDLNNKNKNNNILPNSLQINKMSQMNNDIKFDAYKLKKDSIEYLINKEENIFYYLIRCENYGQIKKSLESNTIQLPESLYNKYKDIDIKNNKLTIIIFVFDDEYSNFAGFAQLKYPLPQKNSKDNEENEKKVYENYYKIEWLWRTKLHYSKVNHLMNRADNDHFLNEGKNGCPIDKDLGNYCCRLMIKRLSKDEVKELINEKKIFENQNKLLQNLKKEEYKNNNNYNNKYNNSHDNNTNNTSNIKYNNNFNNKYNNSNDNNNNNNSNTKYNNNFYNNHYYSHNNSDKKYNNNFDYNSDKKYNHNYKYEYNSDKKFNNNYDYKSDKKYNNKYNDKSPYKYSNQKKIYNDTNSNKYSSNKKDFKFLGKKIYRKNSKSQSHNRKSDSEDYSYKNQKIKKNDEKINSNRLNLGKEIKDNHNYYRYNNDDNKSTDFSNKKNYY